MPASEPWIRDANRLTPQGWFASSLPILVVSTLVCLGAANIASRSAWREVEDGVLWAAGAEGVVAAEIAAGTSAAAVGLQRGDLLVAIDDKPIDEPSDVVEVLHAAGRESTLRYTVIRLGSRDVVNLRVAPVPGRPGALYYVLAAVAMFTLLVGGAVRLRRPRDPATLHFLWLSAAFFGLLTFSFSGRLDRLDWVFYWADVVAILALPPLFLDFTRVFPERRRGTPRSRFDRLVSTVTYAPAVVLGLARVVAVARSSADAAEFVRISETLDRLELLYLAVCFIGGLLVLTRALARTRSTIVRRQLKWIAWGTALGAGPFALGYALPYARGAEPSLPWQLSAIPLSLIPLAYASAIVRYRLRDIEVIIKRALVFATIVAVIVAMFFGLFAAAATDVPVAGGRAELDLRAAGHAGRAAARAPGEGLRADDARSGLLPGSVRLPARARGLCARLEQRPRSGQPGQAAGVARRGNAGRGSDGDSDGPRRRRAVRRHALTRPRDAQSRSRTHVGPGPAAGRWTAGHARRPDSRRPLRPRGHRPVARCGPPLFRAVRVVGGDDRRAGAGAQARDRAAEQRGHCPAGRGGRPDCDRARECPAVPAAASQGRGAGPPARLQREHPGVSGRRPAGGRPGRSHRALEQRARARVRRDAAGRDGPPAGRPVRRAVPRGGARRAPRVAGGASSCRGFPSRPDPAPPTPRAW